MDLNDTLQWAALGVTLVLGGAGLYLQNLALGIAREDLGISKAQLAFERKRHNATTATELRRLAIEEQKLAERKTAREQRAAGAVVRWLLGDQP